MLELKRFPTLAALVLSLFWSVGVIGHVSLELAQVGKLL